MTISVASDDTTVATVEPAVLVFTMSNWATAQTVTVTGAAAGATSVSHTVLGADYGSVSAPGVDVTVAARGVVVTPEAVRVDPGTTDTYAVVLATAPTGDVTITVASDDVTVASVDEVSLVFTTLNWDSAQTVTVTGEAPGTAMITHAVSGGDYGDNGVSAPGVAVGVRGVVVAPEAVTVDPNTTDTYGVVLASAPTGSVTITVASADTSVATVAPGVLTFTMLNWDTAQTVTITGEAPGTTTIAHGVSGGDYGANDVTAPGVEVTVAARGVVVAPPTVRVDAGGVDTYEVVLTSEPTGDVTISVASDDTTVATVEPAVLVFTMSNWATAQTVTVTGQAAGAATIGHTVLGADYGSVSAPGVDVTVAARGVVVTPEAVTLDPGTTDTYAVVLATAPTGDVTITVASDDVTVASVDEVSLVFTTLNWDSAQTVTVTGQAAGTTMITHAVAGADYGENGVSAPDVAVEVRDVSVNLITVRVSLAVDEPDSGAILATKFATAFSATAVPASNTSNGCTTTSAKSEVDDRATSNDTRDDVILIKLRVSAATRGGSCRYDVTLYPPKGYLVATRGNSVKGVEPGAIVDIRVRVAARTIFLVQTVTGNSGGGSIRYDLSTACRAPASVDGLPPPLLPRPGGGGIVRIPAVVEVSLVEGSFNVTAALADDPGHPDASNGVVLPAFDENGVACVATISVIDLPDRCATERARESIDLRRAAASTIVEIKIRCSDEIERVKRGEGVIVILGLPEVQELTITSADTAGIYTVSWMTRDRCDPGERTSGASGTVVMIVTPSGESDSEPTPGGLTGSVVEELVRTNPICTYAWTASLVEATTGAVCAVGPAPFTPDSNNRIAITLPNPATRCAQGSTIGLEVNPAVSDPSRGAVLARKFTAIAVPADGAPEDCTVSAGVSEVDDRGTPHDVTDDRALIELTVVGEAAGGDSCLYDVALLLPAGFSVARGATSTRDVAPGETVEVSVGVATPSIFLVQNVVGDSGGANARYELLTSCATPASTDGSLSSVATAEGNSSYATRQVRLLPGRFNITAALLRDSPDSDASNGIEIPALDGNGLACRATISVSDLPDQCTVVQDRMDVYLPSAAETTIIEYWIDCSQ